MKKRSLDMTTVYTLGVFALLLAGFLLLVLLGAGTYGHVAESRERNNDQRAVLSYLSISVRNHDHENAVSVERGEEGDVLLLTNQAGGETYVTRIYLSHGELVEEVGRAGAEMGQQQTIGACARFEIEVLSRQCFRVRTDRGSVLLRLRSESEGLE